MCVYVSRTIRYVYRYMHNAFVNKSRTLDETELREEEKERGFYFLTLLCASFFFWLK